MDRNSLKRFCLGFPGAQESLSGEPSNILTYHIAGKKFAYFKTSEPEKWRFSVRVSPERFLELTDQAGVKPARYMHRFHWVTIVKVSVFDSDYLRQLVRWSYNKAKSSANKKRLAALNAD